MNATHPYNVLGYQFPDLEDAREFARNLNAGYPDRGPAPVLVAHPTERTGKGPVMVDITTGTYEEAVAEYDATAARMAASLAAVGAK